MLPRRARKLTVGEVEYRWLVSRNRAGELSVIVQAAAGGPKLTLLIQLEEIVRGSQVAQRTVVSGALVAEAIRCARELGWTADRVLYFWDCYVREEPWEERAAGGRPELVRIDPLSLPQGPLARRMGATSARLSRPSPAREPANLVPG